jgi:hypothetical protein
VSDSLVYSTRMRRPIGLIPSHADWGRMGGTGGEEFAFSQVRRWRKERWAPSKSISCWIDWHSQLVYIANISEIGQDITSARLEEMATRFGFVRWVRIDHPVARESGEGLPTSHNK